MAQGLEDFLAHLRFLVLPVPGERVGVQDVGAGGVGGLDGDIGVVFPPGPLVLLDQRGSGANADHLVGVIGESLGPLECGHRQITGGAGRAILVGRAVNEGVESLLPIRDNGFQEGVRPLAVSKEFADGLGAAPGDGENGLVAAAVDLKHEFFQVRHCSSRLRSTGFYQIRL
jgi:hypothetical protein